MRLLLSVVALLVIVKVQPANALVSDGQLAPDGTVGDFSSPTTPTSASNGAWGDPTYTTTGDSLLTQRYQPSTIEGADIAESRFNPGKFDETNPEARQGAPLTVDNVILCNDAALATDEPRKAANSSGYYCNTGVASACAQNAVDNQKLNQAVDTCEQVCNCNGECQNYNKQYHHIYCNGFGRRVTFLVGAAVAGTSGGPGPKNPDPDPKNADPEVPKGGGSKVEDPTEISPPVISPPVIGPPVVIPPTVVMKTAILY